jgi:hypothetical protein
MSRARRGALLTHELGVRGDALHGVDLGLDAAGRDSLRAHLAKGAEPRQVLEGVGFFVRNGWEKTFSLPCRQLAGLEVQNPEKVLTGISGHGRVSVSRASLADWNVKLYSEYGLQTRPNQARLT